MWFVWVRLLFFCFCVRFSGSSDSHQSSGADPNKAAGGETVVQASDGLHPLRRAERRLAFSVAWLWADTFAGLALLSHVLVQLWEGQNLAVRAVSQKRAHVCHYLHIRSSFWLCKCICSFETSLTCSVINWIYIFPCLSDCFNCYVTIRCCQNKKAGGSGRAGRKEM